MLIVLKAGTSREEAQQILDLISRAGLKPLFMPDSRGSIVGAVGDLRKLLKLNLEQHPLVDHLAPLQSPYSLVSREMHPHDTVVRIGKVAVGGGSFTVIAGPGAVENYQQMLSTAQEVKAAGAHVLRGGAFKPHSSPYSFQGLGSEGLAILSKVSSAVGLPAITEVVESEDVDEVAKHADAFQVGARNMQNYRLLKALGNSHKPVILKRGMAASVEDLLLAADFIVSQGNQSVILCERGIRTFETATRNTLDLNSIPYIKEHSHLPVIVDPSHGTGVREYVSSMTKAAVACGADGILIEVHNDPPAALCDGAQSLYPKQFGRLMQEIKPFVEAAGKHL